MPRITHQSTTTVRERKANWTEDGEQRLCGDRAHGQFKTGLSLETLVTKAKPSGAVKYRLIIDLLRSGGNGLAKIPKRIVLPRV